MTRIETVLSYVTTFPGEYTAAALAAEIGAPYGTVCSAIHRLRGDGLVAGADKGTRLWPASGVRRGA